MVDLSKPFEEQWESYYDTSYSLTNKQILQKNSLERLQDPEFIRTLRSFYTHRDGDKFADYNDADMLEKFYSDRTWRNWNTGSMTADLASINGFMGNTDEMIEEFAFINDTYKNLPNFWDDDNRSFSEWLWDFGGAMLLDPANVIGFGVGKQVATQEYRAVLKKQLQGKMANLINNQLIKKAQLEANKNGLKAAIKRGAIYEGIYSGLVTGVSDTMLQHTAIKSGVQDEFSWKRLGTSTAFGFGIGTIMGGAFSYGSFKWSLRGQGKNSLKNLRDVHNYGFDDLRGGRLFYDLTEPKKKPELYKNKTVKEIAAIREMVNIQARDVDDHIKELRKIDKSPLGKPPQEPFNFERWASKKKDTKAVKALKKLSWENKKWLDERVSQNDWQSIKELAKQFAEDPDSLIKQIKKLGDTNIAAEMLAMRMHIKNHGDDLVKLARSIDDPSLTQTSKNKYIAEFEARREYIKENLAILKIAQERIATAMGVSRIEADMETAASLLVTPKDYQMAKKLDGNIEEYMRAVAKLDDDNHIILALQRADEVNKWDLAAEYVNNALLSSPDTHLINLVSGLARMQLTPVEMLIRAGYMAPKNSARAKEIAGEAIETYVYQYIYALEGIRAAYRSFKVGRPVLDSAALKYDSNIRQGQVAAWLNKNVQLLVGNSVLGRGVQFGASIPIAVTTSPLRVLSSGDELMKTMSFKARAAAQINSRIAREHPEVFARTDAFTTLSGAKDIKKYKELASKYMKGYMDEAGHAKTTVQGLPNSMDPKGLSAADRLVINDPLFTARENTYTTPPISQMQKADGTFAKKGEFDDPNSIFNVPHETGRATGAVLNFTSRHRWLRALGLHFINTPSNLNRFNLQRFPILGKFQFQMRQLLKKDPKTGKYINPEGAAEAHARMTMGMMIWSSAISAAMFGKFTNGGDRDWKVNKNREQITGWQPYAWHTNDGKFIHLNRLDPFVMPFGLAADMLAAINNWQRYNEYMPPEVENQFIELSVAMMTSITRNLSSKFYSKGILESANLFMSDGHLHVRDPGRMGSSFLARTLYKWVPLSGMLRYVNRINDEHEREVWTMMDRLRALNPFDSPHNVMPKRNILGEKIDRKSGWLFGLGKETGLWSSPFAMTNFKDDATARFFQGTTNAKGVHIPRDIKYRPPSKMETKYETDINLKTLRNKEGQSAYDRWMEIKSQIETNYKGRDRTLKEIIELLISDTRSDLYKRPAGTYDDDGVLVSHDVQGTDERQALILKYVNRFENEAYDLMVQEFDQIIEVAKIKNKIREDANKKAKQDWLRGLVQ